MIFRLQNGIVEKLIRESFLEFPATCDYEFNDYLHDKCKDE